MEERAKGQNEIIEIPVLVNSLRGQLRTMKGAKSGRVSPSVSLSGS